MSQFSEKQVNYIEIPAKDLGATKEFFGRLFDWKFVDYGDEYVAFNDGHLDGGFYKSEKVTTTANGGALVIFYAADLEASQQRVVEAGGTVAREIFSFPGGRRFQFHDPNGNEFAIWSDNE